MRRSVVVATAAVLAVAGCTTTAAEGPGRTPSSGPAGSSEVELRFERTSAPDRTLVLDRTGAAVAVFTDGARTVRLTGPSRTFREPKATDATVTTTAWVRLAPQPWMAGAERADWFQPWFAKARTDTSPDVLAVATEYLADAPEERDAAGVRYRGDASFGPVAKSGEGRLERSDFHDYLGLPWDFPDTGSDPADPDRYGAVDCSGFVRLVYGYRLGLPLLGDNETDNDTGDGTDTDAAPGLPRRAYAIAEHGPGVVLVPDDGTRATAYDVLQPGDLVFFEVENGPDQLDHAAIYLGPDSANHHRFISSRERIDGPTMGDVGGTSLLDDGGHYSKAWRAARRL
jgi:cell wall-associated NlpC family hydrolase